jgi:hypothetical protein
MEDEEELDVFFDDLNERVARSFWRKSQRCEFPSRGGKKLFEEVTNGWITGDSQPLAEEVEPQVRPQKRHRKCKDKLPRTLHPIQKVLKR